MEQLLSEIPVTYSDPKINSALRSAEAPENGYRRYFTQTEEFFLRVSEEYTVGSFPIHHDYRKSRPGSEYLDNLRSVMKQLAGLLPSVFDGLTHIFDPAEIFRPAFFRVYKFESQTYLFLLRLDLHHRHSLHTIMTRGDNDRTTSYRTNVVILEADFIPLDDVKTQRGRIVGFQVEQSVSQTWIGETGRGYFVQGIWLDRELTRFFSKLFTAPGIRTYPYYPFTCKYRAICHSVSALDEEGRRKSLPLLHKARLFLLPHLREIESAIRADEFSEKLPGYVRLREAVPASWNEIWGNFSMKVYLNSDDQKEYELEHGLV